jgi:hypothetical protein
MVGRTPRYEIEIMIIHALQEEFQLRYTDLRGKIDSRCQVLGLKEPSNDAFYSRLTNLYYEDVLVKEKDKYGGTYYSLKNNHYIGYLERTFSSLPKYRKIPFSLDVFSPDIVFKFIKPKIK